MKLTVLTENVAGGKCLAEHGLSYLIEFRGEKILFDTGHSDVFLRNATLLGLNLNDEVDTEITTEPDYDQSIEVVKSLL